MNIKRLSDKYRVAAPRYTSYPTVPYWDKETFSEQAWISQLRMSYSSNPGGISLYIHLPFCEDLCTYCGCNTRITKNHRVEEPYIAAVLKEWKLYTDILGERPQIREIHLGGGTPTFFSPANLKKLIIGILSAAELHAEAELSIEGHPNNTTEEHLHTLYSLGFRRLSLGIQDFDPAVQLIINRIQTIESVSYVTNIARQMGYHSINYDLIYGLPLQSLNGLADTIEQVIKLKPDRIAFYSYAHVPWVKPGQRRYTEEHLPDAALKIKLYELGRVQLRAAGYVEIGMDHFTLSTDTLYKAEQQGKLHRNFMGYTEQPSRVTIGLGVSSISDCWNGFAQNVKNVEEYSELVESGRLPVVKGHILNGADLVIRQHIMNIMCKGFTSWTEGDMQYQSFAEGLRRMESMEIDGLVSLDRYFLRVTPTGKRFLRNICMALDARLWKEQPATQLFSMAD